MIDYSVDTNVFSKIFKSDLQVRQFVESLNFAVCTTIYIECLQGSKSNQEKRFIKNYLDGFSILPITPDISQLAVDLIWTYSNSHGLLLPDAFIAATALENDLTLVTYNVDDFKFINGLKWLKPPV